MQTVRLVCYRGRLSDPKWVDQDQRKFLPFIQHIAVLTWSIAVSFSPFCAVRVDLSAAAKDLGIRKAASGQVYYQLDYDVVILFGLTELQAYLSWNARVSHGAITLAVKLLMELCVQEGQRR